MLYLKCDSKLNDPHFNSWILIYLELNEKKSELSEALPFQSLFGCFVIVWWPDQRLGSTTNPQENSEMAYSSLRIVNVNLDIKQI